MSGELARGQGREARGGLLAARLAGAPLAVALERIVHEREEPVGVEGLLEKVEGAVLERPDRCRHVAVPGQDQHRDERPAILAPVLELEAVDPRELEVDDRASRLQDRGALIPVLFLTGHGDVPAAVRALKHGALDFLQKPFDADRLLELVDDALERDGERRAGRARRDQAVARLAALTPREREVMQLVAEGRANKAVAAELAISERTVELHRSRIMRKTGARSVPDLVRLIQCLES